jgi:hypothetical protein
MRIKSWIFSLLISFLTLGVGPVTEASYFKTYQSGSSPKVETNLLAGSYSFTTPDDTLMPSPWEMNGMIGQSKTGSDSSQVTTDLYGMGGSYYFAKLEWGISALVFREAARHGASSLKPLMTLDKSWGLGNSDPNSEISGETEVFRRKIRVSLSASKKNVSQPGDDLSGKDFHVEQRTVTYGLTLDCTSWLTVDLSTSRFNYDEDLTDANTVASRPIFLDRFGYSYLNIIDTLSDKENSLRLSFKVARESALETTILSYHSLATQTWYRDYSLIWNSVFLSNWGYALGGTRSETSDGSDPIYSGEASLIYYF